MVRMMMISKIIKPREYDGDIENNSDQNSNDDNGGTNFNNHEISHVEEL
jgi:hypothetical protein